MKVWIFSTCCWRRYCKFDTFHPAVDNGLPVTRVISRVTLQQKLAEAAERYGGESIIQNDCHVVDFEEVSSDSLQHQACSCCPAHLPNGDRHCILRVTCTANSGCLHVNNYVIA